MVGGTAGFSFVAFIFQSLFVLFNIINCAVKSGLILAIWGGSLNKQTIEF